MTESRLGLGWKSPRRRIWCDEGRIKAAKARFTKSPSTVPIRTSEFFIADLWMVKFFNEHAIECDGDCCCGGALLKFLCKLHRKDPGCVVGEHKQVLLQLLTCLRTTCWRWSRVDDIAAIDRRGELDLSIDIRIDRVGDNGASPWRFTRVGDADRWKKLDEVDEQKLELVDEENDNISGVVDEEQNRPDGDTERWNADAIGNTGRLDLLDVVAISTTFWKLEFLAFFLEREKNIFVEREREGGKKGKEFVFFERGPKAL